MKVIFYILLHSFIFIPSVSYAQLGLIHLNKILSKEWYLSYKYIYDNNFTSSSNQATQGSSFVDIKNSLNIEYGVKFNSKSQFTTNVSIINSKQDQISNTQNKTHYATGVQEPIFTYTYYKKFEIKEGNGIDKINFFIQPSLFDKKIRTKNANNAVGKHSLGFEVSTSAIYERWESRLLFSYKHYFHGRIKNIESNQTYTSSPYYSLLLGSEFQYRINDMLFLYSKSGLSLIHDQNINNNSSNTSELIQFGTGAFIGIGIKYNYKNAIWNICFNRMKNDYSVQSENNNFSGKLNQRSFTLEYIRLY